MRRSLVTRRYKRYTWNICVVLLSWGDINATHEIIMSFLSHEARQTLYTKYTSFFKPIEAKQARYNGICFVLLSWGDINPTHEIYVVLKAMRRDKRYTWNICRSLSQLRRNKRATLCNIRRSLSHKAKKTLHMKFLDYNNSLHPNIKYNNTFKFVLRYWIKLGGQEICSQPTKHIFPTSMQKHLFSTKVLFLFISTARNIMMSSKQERWKWKCFSFPKKKNTSGYPRICGKKLSKSKLTTEYPCNFSALASHQTFRTLSTISFAWSFMLTCL